MRYLLGNWKMNMSISEIEKFEAASFNMTPDVYVGVAVPSVYYGYCYKLKQKMAVGLQNASEHTSGAYTGEISAQMIADVQADFCLVGHSERRQFYGETDATANQKIKQLLSHNVLPVLCIGETLAEYEAGDTARVLRTQLEAGLAGVSSDSQIVVAYEPVWAIGTGKTATAALISEVCGQIKAILREIFGADYEASVLYGGSVKSANSGEIVTAANVDGALVGGASLDAIEFNNILKTFL